MAYLKTYFFPYNGLVKVWLFSQIYIEDHFITGAPTHPVYTSYEWRESCFFVEVTFKQSLES